MKNAFPFFVILSLLTITNLILTPFGYTQSGGSGTEANPYIIATNADLQWLAGNSSVWGAYFLQTADVSAVGISNPIGGSPAFTGGYNGLGHTITGLSLSSSSANQGLFGFTNGAEIKNLRVTGASVTGGSGVGILIGRADGPTLVSNVFVSGTVVSSATGASDAGGFVGFAVNIAVSNSGADVSVSAAGRNVGGFVGDANRGTYDNCYALGDVISTGTRGQVGGFGGLVRTDAIRNSYARGNATQATPDDPGVGGFIGRMINNHPITPLIENNYSTGSPSGGTNIGGFVGIIGDSGIVFNNNFFNTTTSGTSTAVGAGTASGTIPITGITTGDMQTNSTFTTPGWDFNTDWFITSSQNDGFPIIQWTAEPSGTITIVTGASDSQENWTLNNGVLKPLQGDPSVSVSDIIGVFSSPTTAWDANNLTIEAPVDIIIDADVNPGTSVNQSFYMKAGRDIVLAQTRQIDMGTNTINVIFWSDTNGDESGGVLLDFTSSIDAGSGNLWIGGGDNTSLWNNIQVGHSYAVGLTNTENSGTSIFPRSGINAVGASISANLIYMSGKSRMSDYRFGIGTRINGMEITGNELTIYGIGSENSNTGGDTNRGNWGVGIENTDILASGHIEIEGTGGGQNLTSSVTNGGQNHGVRMDNNSSIITSGSGNISITGTGGTPAGSNTDNDGLRIDGGIIRVNTGTLSLHGTAGSNSNSQDIDYTNGVLESKEPISAISTGDIEISANTLIISSGVRFRSEGDLRIEPRTSSTTIGIAGATGTLSLPSSYFSTNFEDGFDNFIIGSPDQTGLININNFEAFNGLQIQSELVQVAGGQTFTIPQNVAFTFMNNTNFTVTGTANLEVAPGGIFTLTDNATLTNNGAVNVRSSAFFNNQGSSTPPVTFHRDMEGAEGWRYLTAPVSTKLSTLLDPIWTQGAANANTTSGTPNVYRWGNVTGKERDGWVKVEDLDETISAGEGVLVFVYADDNFDGTPNTFPKSLSVTGPEFETGASVTTNTADANGWTLLGNPFGTAISFIDLRNSIPTSDNLSPSIYVWAPNNSEGAGGTDPENPSGSWFVYNTSTLTGDLTDGLIAPFQAFFVENDEASGVSISFTNAIKSTNISATQFLFKQGPQQHIRLELTGNGMRNSAWLAFNSDGSLAERTAGDAWQLEPMSADYALLATNKPGVGLMDIGHYPDRAELQIPLVATATRTGSYTLSVSEAAMSGLYLNDLHTGRSIPIEQGAAYEFQINTTAKAPATPFAMLKEDLRKSSTGDHRFTISTEPRALEEDTGLPGTIALNQNYPNPFNPTTTISYELPESNRVQLHVYDLTGRQIATLVDGQISAGVHRVSFDASNLSSGVYIYRLTAGGQQFTHRLTLVK